MIVYGTGSTWIETFPDESDEQLKEAVNSIIVAVYKKIPDWLKYEFGRLYERRGIFYREFICVAGSVHGSILIYATKNNWERAIIMRGSRDDIPICLETRAGIETEFDCDEFSPVE